MDVCYKMLGTNYASASGFFSAGGWFTGYLLPDPILGRKKNRLRCLVPTYNGALPALLAGFHLHTDYVRLCVMDFKVAIGK